MGGEKKNTNKLLVGIIVVLLIVIAGLVVYVVTGRNNNGSSNSSNDSNYNQENELSDENTADSSETVSTENTEKQAADNDSQTEDDCYITITNSNSWEADGGYAGQFDVKISNETAAEVSDWKIEIQLPDGASLDSSWNGNYELKDNLLTITAVDYNGKIPASGEISDIGFIMKVSAQNDLQTITANATLYADGNTYSVDDSNRETSNTTESVSQNTTEPNSETATETTTDTSEDSKTAPQSEKGTPLDNHGKLSVSGTDLVDENGDKYQLKGVSTHGIAWFPDYVSKDTFKTFRDDWGANLIRIAMYTEEYNGYCSGGDQTYLKNLVETGVNAATELGMYVIVDWHILNDSNPQTHKDEAKAFFEEMSKKYSDYDNVLYEICNEPNGGTTWSDIKAYAEEVIPVIRANAPDAIIIVGTPTWSQDVDIASQDPITGYDNIMYTIHFYAATHTDSIRNKVETAISNGLPLFISEFSICDASGNGAIDYDQADKWFDLVAKYNLSYAGWNVSNKDETSSLIRSDCTKTSDWTDDELSDTGIWLKNQIKGSK